MKTVMLLGMMMAGVGGVVFAQAVDSVVSVPYAKEGALAASLGALIWAVKHLMTRTIPDQQAVFQTTLDKITERSERHDEVFRESMEQMGVRCQQVHDQLAERTAK